MLIRPSLDGFSPIDPDWANELCVRWGHELGPCRRPFGLQAFTFDVDGEPVSVAISASTVSTEVVGTLIPVRYDRTEVVELARLCSANSWANRLMLRWWREVGARRWPYWPVKAAVSYSDRGRSGDLYRFDGWELAAEDRGDDRPHAALRSRGRTAQEGRGGKKLWLWRYSGT